MQTNVEGYPTFEETWIHVAPLLWVLVNAVAQYLSRRSLWTSVLWGFSMTKR